jgi:uncharacterized membrane protein
MMLVHFPASLYIAVFLLDACSLYFEDIQLALFSFYAICFAVASGWTAVFFGIIDLLKISSEDKSFRTALIHGGLNLTWISAFTVIAGLELKNYPEIIFPSTGKIVTEFIAVSGMLYSNFLGGELVLKYDVGKPDDWKRNQT